MPAFQFKFKIPSVEDLKDLDPKRAAIEHGEKIVVLACVIVLLVTIISLFVGGGEEVITSEKMEKLIEDVKRLQQTKPPPFTVEDLAGEVNRWNEPPRCDTEPWQVTRTIGEQVVLVGETVGPLETITRHPDVKGTIRLRDPRADVGFAWLLTDCRVNKQHEQEFLEGKRPWDQIDIINVNQDVQYAAVTLWFDMGPLIAEYAKVLNVTKLDKQRNTLRLPHFVGFDVQRQDLSDRSRQGDWQAVTVPIPLTPDQRERVRPQPPNWAEAHPEEPWPPPLTNPWMGGTFGLRSVQWVDPMPVEPGRGLKMPAPPHFQTDPEPGIPGGIFFSNNDEQLSLVIFTQMRAYLKALATLNDPNASLGDRQNAGRVTARPHGLGLRFVDTTVEAGRSYRYRLRVKILNPCLDLPNAVPAAKLPEVLASDFSAPTPPVTIPPDTEFFLLAVVPRAAGVERGQFEIHQLKEGRWRCEQSFVRVGEPIRYSGSVSEVNFISKKAPALPGRWRGGRPGGEEEPELKPVKTTVQMTLDTGAILLDIVTVPVLRTIYSRRAAAPEGPLERDLLARVTYLPDTRYQAVFQDARGRVGVTLSGEMPERAIRRRQLSRERLATPSP